MNSSISGDAALQGRRDAYYAELGQENLGPLWVKLSGLVPSEPTPKAKAFKWSFDAVRPRLLQAGELISAEEAERRVLVLENPGLAGTSRITDTMYAGLQLILPGETAPAHRHTQSALRFVIEGEGAFTTVDGERAVMRPGDFIITPAWEWHDHGNESGGPVIWMDGLDVPLVAYLGVGFREEHNAKAQIVARPDGYSDAKYGSGLMPLDSRGAHDTSPLFSYPYSRSRDALDLMARADEPLAHHGYVLRYINPTNGDSAIPTIGASMRLLPKGFRTAPYRSTDGAVLIVMEGRMRATVGGQTFNLGLRDIQVLPLWTTYTFEADEDCVFFMFSDQPVHQKLGFWREHKG